MGGRGIAVVAAVRMDATVDTDITAITAGKGTGVSQTWRQRLLMNKQQNLTLRPL